MHESFVVYIDEAGDEGFRFVNGSSEWFLLSAAITRKENDLETVKLIDDVREKLNKPPKKAIHFRELKHEQRLVVIDGIAKARLRAISILIHKPSLNEPEMFQDKYRLYFYAVRYLLERVSWFCRDHRNPQCSGDGGAKLVFSNRSSMSYEEMKGYLNTLKSRPEVADVRIDWSIISCERLTAAPATSLMGLQIVDAIAGGFYYAVSRSTHGFTEDRYARMLRPIVYKGKTGYRGYGVKIWPREADERAKKEERFHWFREVYK